MFQLSISGIFIIEEFDNLFDSKSYISGLLYLVLKHSRRLFVLFIYSRA